MTNNMHSIHAVQALFSFYLYGVERAACKGDHTLNGIWDCLASWEHKDSTCKSGAIMVKRETQTLGRVRVIFRDVTH